MSIHAISGKPGGGKSMYSVRMMLEELVHGSRPIITNVSLNLGRLNEYLQKEYPNKDIDIFARVRIMDDEMTGKFWTYRPKGRDEWVRIPTLSKEEWSAGKKPQYAGIEDSGVMYVIDECHNFFNARAWAETGRDVLFYLSQHRKLGDTVVWITQAVMNVDKQFRSVTQDYTYLRNLTKEKMGLFRLPAMFVRKTYGSPATDTAQPMETGTFKLNVNGLASLYNTAAGVGIHDRVSADVGERRKGIHWLVPAIGIPLLVLAVVKFVPHGVASFFNPMKHGAPVALQHTNLPAQIADSNAPISVAAENHSNSRDLRSRDFTNVVTSMVSYAVTPIVHDGFVQPIRRINVELSDGRRFHSGDGHLQYLNDEYCVVDGVTNYYRPRLQDPSLLAVNSLQFSSSSPVVSLPDASSEMNSGGGSTVYVMPYSHTPMAHPGVRNVASPGGMAQGFSQGY